MKEDIQEITQKIEKLKSVYPVYNPSVYFTDDCEYVTQIDFESNTVFYYVHVNASCGCCSTPEDREMDLYYFIKYMPDDDFEQMISHYTNEVRIVNYYENAE